MLWNTPLNIPLGSSRLVRRVILDHLLPAGWPFKWGGMWDIHINGIVYPTGLKRLDWTGQQWIDFISEPPTNVKTICGLRNQSMY